MKKSRGGGIGRPRSLKMIRRKAYEFDFRPRDQVLLVKIDIFYLKVLCT